VISASLNTGRCSNFGELPSAESRSLAALSAPGERLTLQSRNLNTDS
jgi:hypothetical protein